VKASIRDLVRREKWATAFEDAVSEVYSCDGHVPDDTVTFWAPIVCYFPGYNAVVNLGDSEP
jgi:hypothetical protein